MREHLKEPRRPPKIQKIEKERGSNTTILFTRAVTENPSSGSNLKLIPALCRRGDRSRRALHRHAFLRDGLFASKLSLLAFILFRAASS